MPFGAGHWPYLFIILVIVLIIWGPGKLPELGSGLGKAIREFKKASTDVRESIVASTADTPPPPAQPAPPPAIAQVPVQPATPPAQQPPVEHPTA